MEYYIIYLNNAQTIENEQDSLIKKCHAFKNIDYEVFSSYKFISGTGYMQTVGDEIEFVLQGYERLNILKYSLKDFIKTWQLNDVIDYDLNHLSDGWKKYLSLALFSNQRSAGKIYFDATRHLSDNLLDNLIENIEKSTKNSIFFFEYDVNMLGKYGFKILYNNKNELSTTQLNSLNFTTESNYELTQNK